MFREDKIDHVQDHISEHYRVCVQQHFMSRADIDMVYDLKGLDVIMYACLAVVQHSTNA